MSRSRWRWGAQVSLAVVGLSCALHPLPGQSQSPPPPAGKAARKSATPATHPVTGRPLAERRQSPAASDSDAVERAWIAAETEATATQLLADRTSYLQEAAWADLGDRCNPGALRVFPKATSTAQQDTVQRLVERMEARVIANGVGARLDTPEALALLRVIVGWEAGIDRPRWDSDDKVVRRAVSAGLTGEVPDPRSSKCLPSPLGSDTVTFVLPGFATMQFPNASSPRVKAYFGKDGQQHARDEFYAARGRADPAAELSYVLVAPVVLWRDWAVVAVTRPREAGGVVLGAGGNGGATYLMRRVGVEWRLLSIVRSRGG